MIKVEDICITLGKRVKEERKKLGLTQEELSEKINTGTEFVSRIERGIGIPSIGTFISLAKALNVSLDSLISEKQTEKNAEKENKKEDKNILKFQYLLSGFSDKQQKQIINFIKEAKKVNKI